VALAAKLARQVHLASIANVFAVIRSVFAARVVSTYSKTPVIVELVGTPAKQAISAKTAYARADRTASLPNKTAAETASTLSSISPTAVDAVKPAPKAKPVPTEPAKVPPIAPLHKPTATDNASACKPTPTIAVDAEKPVLRARSVVQGSAKRPAPQGKRSVVACASASKPMPVIAVGAEKLALRTSSAPTVCALVRVLRVRAAAYASIPKRMRNIVAVVAKSVQMVTSAKVARVPRLAPPPSLNAAVLRVSISKRIALTAVTATPHAPQDKTASTAFALARPACTIATELASIEPAATRIAGYAIALEQAAKAA